MHIHGRSSTFVVSTNTLPDLSVTLQMMIMANVTLRLAEEEDVVLIVVEMSLECGKSSREATHIPAEAFETYTLVCAARGDFLGSRLYEGWQRKGSVLSQKSPVVRCSSTFGHRKAKLRAPRAKLTEAQPVKLILHPDDINVNKIIVHIPNKEQAERNSLPKRCPLKVVCVVVVLCNMKDKAQ
eukprot:6483320-Amphidinium_carterae.1